MTDLIEEQTLPPNTTYSASTEKHDTSIKDLGALGGLFEVFTCIAILSNI